MVFAVGSMKYFSMSKWKHKFVVEVTQMNSPAKPKISKKFNLPVFSLSFLNVLMYYYCQVKQLIL